MDELKNQSGPESKKNWLQSHMILGVVFLIAVMAAIVAGVYYWQTLENIPTSFEFPTHREKIVAPSEWPVYYNDDYGFSAQIPSGVNYEYDFGRNFVFITPQGWTDFDHVLRINPTAGLHMRVADGNTEHVIIAGKKFDKVTIPGQEMRAVFLLRDKIDKWVTCVPNIQTCGGFEYLAKNEKDKDQFEAVLSSIKFYPPKTESTTAQVLYSKGDNIVHSYNPNTQRETLITIGETDKFSSIAKLKNYLFYTRGSYTGLYGYDLTKREEFPIYPLKIQNNLEYTYRSYIFSPDKKFMAISYSFGTKNDHETCEIRCNLKTGIQIYDLTEKKIVREFDLPFQGSASVWAGENLFVYHWVYEGPTDFTVVKTDGTVTDFTRSYSGSFSPDKSYYADMGGDGYSGPSNEAYIMDVKTLSVERILSDQLGYFLFEGWLDDDTFEYGLLENENDWKTRKIYSYSVKTKESKFIRENNEDKVVRRDLSPAIYLKFNQREKVYYLLVNGKEIAKAEVINIVRDIE